MAKIILTDGTEQYLSPGEAHAKVQAGEASFAPRVPAYSTRQLVAEPVKKRRKRKPKVEEEIPEAEPEQVDADEVL